MDRARECARRLRRLAREPEGEGDAAPMVGLKAARGIHRHRRDRCRVLGRDLLDVDTALTGRHQRDAPALAVHHGAEIVLVGDVGAFLQIDAAHRAACGAGLVGNQDLAEHGARRRYRLIPAGADLDPAGLAAPAGVDLGLHHPDRAAERIDGGLHVVRHQHRHAARHRHAEPRQHLLGLIFVEIHGGRPVGARIEGAPL